MEKLEAFDRVVGIGVDIQNDFCLGGTLAVAEGDLVVDPMNTAINWVREQRGHVVFTRDWHPRETNHFAEFGGPWPVHCVAETFGAEFKEGLAVTVHDSVMSKGTLKDEDAYSGFQAKTHAGLTIETLLRPVKHEKVATIIGGLATDYCVKATVLDALKEADGQVGDRHIGVYVLEDAIAAVNVNPGDGETAIQEMKAAGAKFITSQELVNGRVLQVGR